MNPDNLAQNTTSHCIFDEVINRKNTNSIKWDYASKLLTEDESALNPLPMWVADMDFKAPQPVIDALTQAVQHGVFGYAGTPTTSYVNAITHWQSKRFNWDIDANWLMQTSGIITTLKTVVQAFSSPGDSVLIQPPVYAHFHDDMLNQEPRSKLSRNLEFASRRGIY
jgi:cystathionine beta-lyase